MGHGDEDGFSIPGGEEAREQRGSRLTRTLFSVLSPLISSLTRLLSDSFTFLPTASLTLSAQKKQGRDEIKRRKETALKQREDTWTSNYLRRRAKIPSRLLLPLLKILQLFSPNCPSGVEDLKILISCVNKS